VFDDIVEHCGSASMILFQHFLPSVLEYTSDVDPSVRQAAVYGAGLVSQMGGDSIAPFIPGNKKYY
jgi:hypothetical protein